jgi:hypothetical protein
MLRTSVTGENFSQICRGSSKFQCARVLDLPTQAPTLTPIFAAWPAPALPTILPWYSYEMKHRVLRLGRALTAGSLLFVAGCQTFAASVIDSDATTAQDGGSYVDGSVSDAGLSQDAAALLVGCLSEPPTPLSPTDLMPGFVDQSGVGEWPANSMNQLVTRLKSNQPGQGASVGIYRSLPSSRNFAVQFDFLAKTDADVAVPSSYKVLELVGTSAEGASMSNNLGLYNADGLWSIAQYGEPFRNYKVSTAVARAQWQTVTMRLQPQDGGPSTWTASIDGARVALTTTPPFAASFELDLGAIFRNLGSSPASSVTYKNIQIWTCK